MTELGNPAAVIATATALKDKELRKDLKDIADKSQRAVFKTGKVLLISAGTLLGLNVLSKSIRDAKKRKLLASIGTDTDVSVAFQIYDEIPSKHLKSHIPLIGPLFDTIKKLEFWSYSSDDKLLSYAGQIKDINKVVEVFKVVFQEEFYELLQKTMTTANYLKFIELAKKDKTPLNTSKPEWANKYAVTNKQTTIYRVAIAKSTAKFWAISIPLEKGVGVGQSTGIQKRYNGVDYMECKRTMTLNGKGYIVTFYCKPKDVDMSVKAAGTTFNIKVYPDTEILVPVKSK